MARRKTTHTSVLVRATRDPTAPHEDQGPIQLVGETATNTEGGVAPPVDQVTESQLRSNVLAPRGSTLDLIGTVPEHLTFYLKRAVNLEKKPSTNPILLEIIKHFYPEYKPPSGYSKGILINYYSSKVYPLILAYLETQEASDQDEEKDDTSDNAVMMDNTELTTPRLNLSGLNPYNNSITIAIVLKAIKHLHPKVKLPDTMKKDAAIVFWHKWVSPPPVGGYPAPFTTFPKVVPAPFHVYLTRDQLRYALQCHFPRLYTQIISDKDVLIALYEMFVLEDIASKVLYKGIDYHIREDPASLAPQPAASAQRKQTYLETTPPL
ncbi:hypothetical protein PTTG_02341 [Puccinia triticina 1-1 BBBD Race 1]|uniref:Uncharacterized protein n=1 Tax=Puccinia triticina (isolate 1-1 / race 1 (BBBD)) TaxID=630390 RepID=A0A0C4ENJ4_PUCT1|nr:hypothetical protein PTTG_02341 [Puccinia triticina 1-1 BBBD Race 1]